MARQLGALAPITQDSPPPELVVDEDLTKFFFKIRDRCSKLHDVEWLAVKRQMVRARNYFDGRQYGDVNEQCQWVDYPKRAGEISYTVPVYQAHIQTAVTEITKGNTNLSFSHISPDSRKGQLISRIAEERYATHRRRLFPEHKKQQEDYSLLLNGVAARYTYFSINGRYDAVPVLGDTQVDGDSIQGCAECGSPMEGECPNCGSTETSEINAPGFQGKTVVGYSQVQGGENDWQGVDPLGLTWYLPASCMGESPFIGWKQVVLTSTLQAKFPDRQIQGGVKSVELNYQSAAQSSTPQGWSGDSGNNSSCEFEQWWFDPILYQGYVTRAPVKLRNGSTLPAGTDLGKAFSKGLYLALNGQSVMDVWRESKNDKWDICPYVTRLGTMVGAGTSAALQEQDTVNDLRNLQMSSIMNDSFPKEFINTQYLTADQIPNDPTERGEVSNLPDSVKIVGGAIDRLPPAPLSTDAYGMSDKINQEIQYVLGTFSGSQMGSPDLQAVKNTATGMQLWREMTVGRFYPMLALRADMLDKSQALKFLKNDQMYMTPQQWAETKGDYDQEAIQAFLNCDLEKELVIEVGSESFMPISRSQMQAGLMGFGEFMINTQTPPESDFASYAAKTFNIPEYVFDKDAVVSAACGAIRAFKDQSEPIVEQLGDVPSFDINDPTVMAIAELVVEEANCPISFELDDMTTYLNTLKKWWQADDGRSASNVLKAAVHYRCMEIDKAMVQKQQKDLSLSIAAQQPATDAANQAAQDQANAEGQAQQQQLAAEQQKEKDAADREDERRGEDFQAQAVGKSVDIEQANVQREHEKETQDRQDAMTEKQMAHQEKLAKMKPASKK